MDENRIEDRKHFISTFPDSKERKFRCIVDSNDNLFALGNCSIRMKNINDGNKVMHFNLYNFNVKIAKNVKDISFNSVSNQVLFETNNGEQYIIDISNGEKFLRVWDYVVEVSTSVVDTIATGFAVIIVTALIFLSFYLTT